eukprot:CAMPEP_0202458104 /NCGR_PEP_ID=MMETSP1360-20130828/21432_1 /ASSEMBLY_ACC=CAM_ASM_000848 /TAXON_ID=515479 /ORGANISM="Licmophora paradoxa, Strain CCMP2313" /LENGTH=104 /DNA_ID=CAMNT_0049078475 /DNA_START=8 /DNA_END=322 /DNA_ORIENTATION=+
MNQGSIIQISDALSAPEDRAIAGDATKRQMGGAAIVGAILGAFFIPFHGVFLALALAVASAGACTNDGKVGEIARQTGDVTMEAIPKLAHGCKECVTKIDGKAD